MARCARELGHTVLTLDISPKHGPDLCMSVLGFIPGITIPAFVPDFIWASPPCESYSLARSNVTKDEKEEAMRAADKLVAHTLRIIRFYNCHFCIENPASSRLWKREVAMPLKEYCITSYCSFGMRYRKNTRIASSFPLNLPRCPGAGLCPAMIGSIHKEWAQRGGGGVINKYHTQDELHSIPSELCRSVLAQASTYSSV